MEKQVAGAIAMTPPRLENQPSRRRKGMAKCNEPHRRRQGEVCNLWALTHDGTHGTNLETHGESKSGDVSGQFWARTWPLYDTFREMSR